MRYLRKLFIISTLLIVSLAQAAPKFKEEVRLVKIAQADVPVTEGPGAILAVIAASKLGEQALKSLVKFGADELNRYASKYEGAYGTKLILGEDQTPFAVYDDDGRTLPNYFRFSRELIFDENISAEYISKAFKIDQAKASNIITGRRVIAMNMTFKIVPAGDNMRIIPIEINYNVPKAKRLKVPFTNNDELDVIMTFTVRQVGADPIVAEIGKKANSIDAYKLDESSPEKLWKNIGTDWLPAIKNRCYSIEVGVIETSDARKWIEKVATGFKKWGDGEIEKAKKPAK